MPQQCPATLPQQAGSINVENWSGRMAYIFGKLRAGHTRRHYWLSNQVFGDFLPKSWQTLRHVSRFHVKPHKNSLICSKKTKVKVGKGWKGKKTFFYIYPCVFWLNLKNFIAYYCPKTCFKFVNFSIQNLQKHDLMVNEVFFSC